MKTKATETRKMNMKAGKPSMDTCMVPQCEIRMEECADGCKIYCCCDDEVACMMMQKLCSSLSCDHCSVCCCMDDECVCECNFSCCDCTCEMTENGICICCKSSDKKCVKMIKQLCECLCCCCENGCTCTVCFDKTPICQCGC